ncbi:DUF3486 family protein [Sediminispirochaeta bajacaliforniensis]|uniref:DUF3486 family protein n=1 Tax=Sediminispirochaeta bajacaliforniensis TaxID=148 RepID=UPI00035D8AB7|nr:DUF3486 family protein [Sediminispirochaeta bajacaliforniensis]
MGGKSSIDRLDPELRSTLIELLNDPNVTQQAIADTINDAAGEKVVSKSAVNRYALKMRQFTERNRQARELADAYLDKYGEEKQNQLGKVINHQLRLVVFDLMLNLQELQDGDPEERIPALANLINKVARGVRDLEQAAHTNAERERKLKQEVAVAAEDVAKTAKTAGVKPETILLIKNRILGIS